MIYFLEDDANIRNFVVYALNNSSLEAKGFEHPKDFWEAMDKEIPELLLLDIMLPEEDGIQILSKIRENPKTTDLPIIMLTAKSTEYDKVVGLDSGADDYITKPFGTMELISRVKAMLRRTAKRENGDSKEAHIIGNLYFYPDKHIVKVNNKDVTLTYKEFQLLNFLIESKGRVLTRDEILTHIWGYDFDGENRTVDVHIRTLRSKLGDVGNLIETVRGIGYKIGGTND